jgi:hypothetical protein
VLPSTTDTAITTYTSLASFQYHTAFVNLGVTPKNLLFVFLTGTGGVPAGYDRIDSLAANMGYHSIGLMYPNTPSVGSLCSANSDSLCFENVRLEIIDGINRSNLINVDTTNCIEHRLIKLIQYLQTNFPSENWSQYLDNSNQLRWDKIVISGHSQGGGHAGILAKYHQVKRVVFFASPKDYNLFYNKQAAWYNGSQLTPSVDYFGFSHSADSNGSTPAQQLACYVLLGMNSFGPVVDVDTSTAPYNNSHTLTSSLTSTNPHSCVVVDNVVAVDINNIPIYRPVWYYMLDISVSTGINNYITNDSPSIFPNPANTFINIECDNGYKIYNAIGSLIWESQQSTTSIFIGDLTKGIYFLKTKSKVHRFIKN